MSSGWGTLSALSSLVHARLLSCHLTFSRARAPSFPLASSPLLPRIHADSARRTGYGQSQHPHPQQRHQPASSDWSAPASVPGPAPAPFPRREGNDGGWGGPLQGGGRGFDGDGQQYGGGGRALLFSLRSLTIAGARSDQPPSPDAARGPPPPQQQLRDGFGNRGGAPHMPMRNGNDKQGGWGGGGGGGRPQGTYGAARTPSQPHGAPQRDLSYGASAPMGGAWGGKPDGRGGGGGRGDYPPQGDGARGARAGGTSGGECASRSGSLPPAVCTPRLAD